MVLHDISNNTKLIEVASTALSAEGFLEGDLHVVNVMSVPGSTKERVAESHDENVLDHLLSEVVVNTVELLLFPVRLQRLLQLARAGKVLSEGLLDLQASD
jgi:hypothetical protein